MYEDADGYKYVAYSKMVPVLVEAIKDVGERAERLEKENQMLKMKLNEYDARLAMLEGYLNFHN